MRMRSSVQAKGTAEADQGTVPATAPPVQREGNEPAADGPENELITFLFVRLNEIPGSEAEETALADELAGYREIIEAVGGEFQAITRLLNASTALLLFRCTPGTETPSRKGIQAAVTLRRRLEALNRQRLAAEAIPFRIGIGVHSDSLSLSLPDERQRLRILQASVRDAEGLCLLNRQAPFPAIFVSRKALQGLGGNNGYNVQNLGEAFVPNQSKALTVYALM